jgi:hypothetical protein
VAEGGAHACFSGGDAPVTQSFGPGIFNSLDAATLDAVERFFFERGTAAVHDASPPAGVDVRAARVASDVAVWADAMARGWVAEYPEFVIC